MEILRVPPFPLTTVWDVPEANANYVIYLEDLVDHSFENIPVTSNSNAQIEYVVSRSQLQFDREFLFRVMNETGEILVEDTLDIVRPYISPYTLGTTASEIEEFKSFEIIARSVIDSYVGGSGFYNRKHVVQRTGDGTDYFPLWERSNRVLKVYENDVLVYDVDAENPTQNEHIYRITMDNSAIYRIPTEDVVSPDGFNRAESFPIRTPRGSGDLVHSGYRFVSFPKGYDYIFVLDSGYKALPSDVEKATNILINDLKCGKLDYYQKYVKTYDTEQFEIEMHQRMLDGTGNLIVDKILDNYVVSITRPGVI